MANFPYAVKVLSKELSSFLEAICEGVPRPIYKLFINLVFGVIRTKSLRLSEIARSLGGDATLDGVEHRLARAISKADPSAIRSSLSACSAAMGRGFLALDETDVQKPSGKSFQWICRIPDGSSEGRPVGKGYRVIGLAAIGMRESPIPGVLWAYSTEGDGFVSQRSEASKVIPPAPGKSISMDRRYDGSGWMRDARSKGMSFVVRAKSNRVYSVPSMKNARKTATAISSAIKGRCSFRFPKPGKPREVDVKATAVRIAHPTFRTGVGCSRNSSRTEGRRGAAPPT